MDYNIDDYMNAYYGSNQYKLIEIKKKYDPYNVFNFTQSIPVL
jgi:FAD/FMN-containing dehydrogenase